MNESDKKTVDKMPNSKLFRRILDQRCEIEEQWKENGGPPVSGWTYEIHGVDSIHWKKATAPILPFSQLREQLKINEAGEGQQAVGKLDDLSASEFSVEQIIDGCAHALWFQEEQSRVQKLRRVTIEIRDAAVLSKNQGWGVARAKNRAIAACTINPSVSSAGKLLSLSPLFSEYGEIRDCQIPIKFHKYGCAYYQKDRMKIPKPTYTDTLLALNLEYIFRHWPVSLETYPSYPPKKQPRGQKPEESKGAPRLDIVAHFINQLFNPSGSAKDLRQIKEMLKDIRDAGAVFCGW